LGWGFNFIPSIGFLQNHFLFLQPTPATYFQRFLKCFRQPVLHCLFADSMPLLIPDEAKFILLNAIQ